MWVVRGCRVLRAAWLGWKMCGCEFAERGMVGGGGVKGRYGQVGSSMRGMARLRRISASSWAVVSWARMLFGARVDGTGPFWSSEYSGHLCIVLNYRDTSVYNMN